MPHFCAGKPCHCIVGGPTMLWKRKIFSIWWASHFGTDPKPTETSGKVPADFNELWIRHFHHYHTAEVHLTQYTNSSYIQALMQTDWACSIWHSDEAANKHFLPWQSHNFSQCFAIRNNQPYLPLLQKPLAICCLKPPPNDPVWVQTE